MDNTKVINRLNRTTGVPKPEIEQEIAIKWDAIMDSFDGRISFEQYLFICMRRHLTRTKREIKTVPMSMPLSTTEDTGTGIDNDYFVGVLRDKLSEPDLYLVLARFYEGRRVVDLAKDLGCSTSNIYLRIKKIKGRMKALGMDVLYQRGEK